MTHSPRGLNLERSSRQSFIKKHAGKVRVNQGIILEQRATRGRRLTASSPNAGLVQLAAFKPKEAWQALRSPVSEHLQAMIRWRATGAVPIGVLPTNTPSTLAEVGRPGEPRREHEIDEGDGLALSVTRDLSHWAGVDALAVVSPRPRPDQSRPTPPAGCYLLAARMVLSLVKRLSDFENASGWGRRSSFGEGESSRPCPNLTSSDPRLICRSGDHSWPRLLCT